jgi:hypothetical protein
MGLEQKIMPSPGRLAAFHRGIAALRHAAAFYTPPESAGDSVRLLPPPPLLANAKRMPSSGRILIPRPSQRRFQVCISLRYPDDRQHHCFLNRPALTCSHGITSVGFCSLVYQSHFPKSLSIGKLAHWIRGFNWLSPRIARGLPSPFVLSAATGEPLSCVR